VQIDKKFLQEELQKMEAQRNHAHEVAVAAQAAADVLKALIARSDLPEEPAELAAE
jgi:hypothetical protein